MPRIPLLCRPQALSVALLVLLGLTAACTPKAPNSVIDERAYLALRGGRLNSAEHLLDRAIWQDNTDWVAHYYTGLLRLEQNRPMDAQLALEKSLAVYGSSLKDSRVLDALAEALYRQGKTPQLAAMLAEASRDFGRTADFLRQAQFLAKAGDQDGAALALNKAAAMAAPDDPSPYLAMYRFYDSVGNGAKAVQALKYAYYFRPDDPELAAALRRYGIVPGPTVAEKPPQPSPDDQPVPQGN